MTHCRCDVKGMTPEEAKKNKKSPEYHENRLKEKKRKQKRVQLRSHRLVCESAASSIFICTYPPGGFKQNSDKRRSTYEVHHLRGTAKITSNTPVVPAERYPYHAQYDAPRNTSPADP